MAKRRDNQNMSFRARYASLKRGYRNTFGVGRRESASAIDQRFFKPISNSNG